MNEMRTIRLYGVLGATFGRVHKLAVSTPKEALRALSVVVPGFEAFVNSSNRRGLAYAVFRGEKNIGISELESDRGKEDIRIAPIIIGSKQAGVFQTILGSALFVAGALISYFSAGTLAAVGVGMM